MCVVTGYNRGMKVVGWKFKVITLVDTAGCEFFKQFSGLNKFFIYLRFMQTKQTKKLINNTSLFRIDFP